MQDLLKIFYICAEHDEYLQWIRRLWHRGGERWHRFLCEIRWSHSEPSCVHQAVPWSGLRRHNTAAFQPVSYKPLRNITEKITAQMILKLFSSKTTVMESLHIWDVHTALCNVSRALICLDKGLFYLHRLDSCIPLVISSASREIVYQQSPQQWVRKCSRSAVSSRINIL